MSSRVTSSRSSPSAEHPRENHAYARGSLVASRAEYLSTLARYVARGCTGQAACARRMRARMAASFTRASAPPSAVAVLIVPKLKSDTSAWGSPSARGPRNACAQSSISITPRPARTRAMGARSVVDPNSCAITTARVRGERSASMRSGEGTSEPGSSSAGMTSSPWVRAILGMSATLIAEKTISSPRRNAAASSSESNAERTDRQTMPSADQPRSSRVASASPSVAVAHAASANDRSSADRSMR